jgi:hypothetical protein
VPFWYATLAVAGIVLLLDVVSAAIIRNYYPGSVTPFSFLLPFLANARFPLYALSGFVAGLQGTWVDGVISGLVVAVIDGSVGWWLSARILKPRLTPQPRTRHLSTTIPLALLVPIVVGPLCGGTGALVSLLWR